jgi:hypothetical protein
MPGREGSGSARRSWRRSTGSYRRADSVAQNVDHNVDHTLDDLIELARQHRAVFIEDYGPIRRGDPVPAQDLLGLIFMDLQDNLLRDVVRDG